jgi:annexin A7/11
MAYRTPEERCKVAIKYKETHGKELKAVMKSECGSRDFGTALQLLALSPDLAEVDIIHKACRGLGTDELLLYPVICGRSSKEINHLKKKYFEVYSKDLGGVLDGELGGNFEKLVFHCLQGLEEDVDPGYHTDDLVDEDVDAFYAMGDGKWGTDEGGLFKLLCSRPAEHLKKVNLKYAEKHDVTLFKVMDTELGGDTREATLFLLGMKLRPYETIAKLIKKACKGSGTNELLLSCTLIRYQIVLKEVMLAYVELYGDTLQELIKSEVGGDYKRLLVEMCDAAMS